MLCIPDIEDGRRGEQLLRPQFGMHRFEWPDDDSVEFHLPHGEMIALLRDSGFEVEELIEVRAARRRQGRLSARAARVVPAVALRGDLEGSEAGLNPLRAVRPTPTSGP